MGWSVFPDLRIVKGLAVDKTIAVPSKRLPWPEFLSTLVWNGEFYYPRDGSSYNATYFKAASLGEIRGAWEKTLALIRTGAAPQDIGLYIHWPFCPSHCDFCACSMAVPKNQAEMEAALEAILKEMDSFSEIFKGYSFSSFWMGGGTPTFMTDEMLESLMSYVHKSFAFSHDAQIYVEASPATLTDSKLDILLGYGLNRITLGIQSFDDSLVKTVDRQGQKRERTLKIFEKLKSVSGLTVDVDLMIGLDGQSREIFLEDVKNILELRPHFLHVYGFDDRPQTLWSTRGKSLSKERRQNQRALLGQADKVFQGLGYLTQRDDISEPSLYPWEEKQDGGLRKFRSSVLGIGPSAISHAFGAAWYMHPLVGRAEYGSVPTFLWMESDREEEMRGYAIWYLSRNHRLSRKAFLKLFGEDIMKTGLSGIIGSWANLFLANIDDDFISLKPMDLPDREVLLKGLYSRKIISALGSKWAKELKSFCGSFPGDGSWREKVRRKNDYSEFRVYRDSRFWDRK